MSHANPSILLVDHTPYLENRMGDALVDAGFDILVADSASDCLDRLRREEVDVVLTSHALVIYTACDYRGLFGSPTRISP